jgi:hypothetical protein
MTRVRSSDQKDNTLHDHNEIEEYWMNKYGIIIIDDCRRLVDSIKTNEAGMKNTTQLIMLNINNGEKIRNYRFQPDWKLKHLYLILVLDGMIGRINGESYNFQYGGLSINKIADSRISEWK